MPSYSVITFGCQMNVHDSSRMEEVLKRAGYHAAEGVEESDVILLNTCSIRDKAEQKLRSEVGRLGLLKQKRPEIVIGVAGCVAQQEGERLLKGLPQIDLILGPDNIAELPSLLASVETGGLPEVRTVFDVDRPSFLAASPEPGSTGATAFVTVMKGCNERCSYCVVPHTRGPERYRPSREIIDECRRFVESGAREVTLLGQTVNSYRDPSGALPRAPDAEKCQWRHTRGALARQDETQFPALLRAIAEQVPELLRLRYVSPHPRHLTSSLIAAHRDLPVLCSHVHMPVQSGSDAQLRRMIRRYSAAEYIERTEALKRAVPGLTLSTDVIVGFPGETEEDFEWTVDLVRRVGFVALFGFKYSPRPFTPALKLGDDISEPEKGRRLERLFSVVDEQKAAHLKSLVSSEQEVLIEGRSKSGHLTGRTARNEIVHLLEDKPADSSSSQWGTGALALVQVTEAFRNSLAARPLRVLHPAPHAHDFAGRDSSGRWHKASTSPPLQRALPVVG